MNIVHMWHNINTTSLIIHQASVNQYLFKFIHKIQPFEESPISRNDNLMIR